ncbi:Hsp20/alpha crystallin family protein [Comamonas aquatica]|jgi:HSP20 family molecular chaperone IbpA|uniref:Hsp20/alpha crystallin family protein n=1 Tax=Comamonas aquatica TaxID=225991 RepID=A0AA43AXE2_9BURK|nr:Hsp20/alpha crystallin family protein [Comamonas aquatica]MDH0200665.1 Hsp20/alpha crystallin family protein [Comamonas aquatica]MDH0372544.1 Hsp20/alpha crystallin family protein [Comamonas aquatica]MDH0381588.1 Hsp20/alpha crystallin family protein [Comamonas aquatica]MDH0429517.1 Hsp20/alpha crystallin family protein [Comamonas aquatica]MDH0899943.1 Hsp20/alpha crystallin family protein [Comamonas aquatica]
MFLATPIIRHVTRPDASLQRFMQAATSAAQQLNGDFQVTQSDEATVLSIDVPGLSREQLQLRIEDHMVHLHSVEGAPRQVRRSWELPHEIDVPASSAKLDLGVLTLTLQRRKPVDKTVTLNIQ